MIDVDEGVRPEALLQFLSRHYFAGALQQDGKNLKRLSAEFEFQTGFMPFARLKVSFCAAAKNSS